LGRLGRLDRLGRLGKQRTDDGRQKVRRIEDKSLGRLEGERVRRRKKNFS